MFKASETIIILLLTGIISILLIHVSKGNDRKDAVFSEEQQTPIVNVMTRGGDDRYTMAPRPQRMWDNGPEIPVRGALDPIPTRGEPERYQQMGVIVGSDGKALPLYGRRTAPRSDRFQYYTRTDTYNPVALPITYKKRDCQDGVGCDEIMSGDEVKLVGTGDHGKVTLYGFDGPRYVG